MGDPQTIEGIWENYEGEYEQDYYDEDYTEEEGYYDEQVDYQFGFCGILWIEFWFEKGEFVYYNDIEPFCGEETPNETHLIPNHSTASIPNRRPPPVPLRPIQNHVINLESHKKENEADIKRENDFNDEVEQLSLLMLDMNESKITEHYEVGRKLGR